MYWSTCCGTGKRQAMPGEQGQQPRLLLCGEWRVGCVAVQEGPVYFRHNRSPVVVAGAEVDRRPRQVIDPIAPAHLFKIEHCAYLALMPQEIGRPVVAMNQLGDKGCTLHLLYKLLQGMTTGQDGWFGKLAYLSGQPGVNEGRQGWHRRR